VESGLANFTSQELCSRVLLYLLNCVTETTQVTKGCKLASPAWNDAKRVKTEVQTCPSATLSTKNVTWTDPQ